MAIQKPPANTYNDEPGESAHAKSPSSPSNDCTNSQAIATTMLPPAPLPDSPFVLNYSSGSSPSSFWSPASSTTSHTLSPIFSPAPFKDFTSLAYATPHHIAGNALALDVRFGPDIAADWLRFKTHGFPVERGIDPALTLISSPSALTSDSGNPPVTSASDSEPGAGPSRKRSLHKRKTSDDDDDYVEENGEGDSEHESVAARLKRRREVGPRKRTGGDREPRHLILDLTTLTGPGAFRCEDCNRSFKRIYELNRHLRATVAHGAVRDGLWRHACSCCFITYARDDALTRHHTDTDYDCETADEALRERWMRLWSSDGTMIAPEETRAKAAERAQKKLQ
ncbi:hypothetical protein EXIGLDRAFT_831476 [Exidia glandulosa HHB12029]|uniref:C2H2-type domain-containing protein n=1 Tax=Exidia glandulosa HHB12029 TaxID=1314781 RepID=A0A166BA47_EXIGL|nr:hypothetical protein EXIGLDRAFT_831476 [Exidia glandulosa HHB12029]